MKIYSLFITCFLCLSFSFSNAQGLELRINNYFGFWTNVGGGSYKGGTGIQLDYAIPLPKGSLLTGMEFRTIDWGNELSMNNTFRAPYLSKEKWDFNGRTSVGLGLALFYETPLFSWSCGYMPEFIWLKDKRISISTSLGIRYSNSPAYKKYGSIYQLMEIPFSVGFKFNGRKE